MDIHKQFTVTFLKDEQGTKLAEAKFVNGKKRFQSFLVGYAPQEAKFFIESPGAREYIYGLLEELRYEVKFVNSVRTRIIAEVRIKADSVEASTLADLLLANFVVERYIPPKP